VPDIIFVQCLLWFFMPIYPQCGGSLLHWIFRNFY
jgi:hypothetical protein